MRMKKGKEKSNTKLNQKRYHETLNRITEQYLTRKHNAALRYTSFYSISSMLQDLVQNTNPQTCFRKDTLRELKIRTNVPDAAKSLAQNSMRGSLSTMRSGEFFLYAN